jgi:hypothetical protein
MGIFLAIAAAIGVVGLVYFLLPFMTVSQEEAEEAGIILPSQRYSQETADRLERETPLGIKLACEEAERRRRQQLDAKISQAGEDGVVKD